MTLVSSEDVAVVLEEARGRDFGGMRVVLCGAWRGSELCAASIKGVTPFLSGRSMVCGKLTQR